MKSTALQNVSGPADLYDNLLTLKAKTYASGLTITKKECKALGLDWSFVENCATLLGLTLTQTGNYGFVIGNGK